MRLYVLLLKRIGAGEVELAKKGGRKTPAESLHWKLLVEYVQDRGGTLPGRHIWQMGGWVAFRSFNQEAVVSFMLTQRETRYRPW